MNRFYRKFFVGIIAIAAMQLLFCINAFANNVSDILMDVLIHDNGSATITERWTGSFNEGTENYIPIEDKSLSISNFKVMMNDRVFEYKNNWDVNASFGSKKYKCGINKTYSGVELCFGISEYGNNTYTFSYDIAPLVKGYTDFDGFNFMFLNPDMSIYPSNASIRIHLENGTLLSEENTRIWGFGYDGEVGFNDGAVVSYTTSKLYSNNQVILMLALNKNIISPDVNVDASFESVREEAFVGSSYQDTIDSYNGYQNNNGPDLFLISFFMIIAVAIIMPIVKLIFSIRRHLKLNKYYKEVEYFRDTPNGGDMSLSHVLFNDFDIWNSKESNIIGALIMKMIYDKNLEPLQEKTTGFFGIEKTNTSLRLVSEPTEDTARRLYDIIKMAAGSDGILQENELKKYATAKYEVLNNFLLSIESSGHTNLNKINGYNKIFGKNLKDLTDVGKKELSEVYGLRKYLDEFTLIKEREINEVVIWENLLIYATLFGIAKKVLKDLKKVYPDKIVEIEDYTRTVYISDVYFRALYFSSINARQAAVAAQAARRAASGFGGHVSLGGGGGFSGGGYGGGSR